jgi:hypothetical protein
VSPSGGGLGWGRSPLLKPKRGVRAKGKHEVAGEGTPAFAPGTGTRALGEPSEPSAERGHPRGLRAQSPGALSFGSFEPHRPWRGP